jgi:predicted nicotinamide N-methyase
MQDALNCLKSNDVQLLVCTDLLEHGSGPGLVAAAKALSLANRFLAAKQVSQDVRRTVNNSRSFEDLMKRYIKERGAMRRS